jgi:hypothetical protein
MVRENELKRITMIEGKDINVELTPQEIKQRTRVFVTLLI